MNKLIKIGISIGDINGIGPEIIVKSLSSGLIPDGCEIIVFGAEFTVSHMFKKLKLSTKIPYKILEPKIEIKKIDIGIPTALSGQIAYKSLELALNMASNNQIDAIVTAPVSKKAFQLANYSFTGQTEVLQSFFPTYNAQMLFYNDDIKLLLLTRHIPIKDVSTNITKKSIINNVTKLCQNLKTDFGCSEPSFAICGLNPHAGEDGLLGREEIDVIIPAINELKDKSINICGPFPADSIWKSAKNYDCVIAMYHDQGLIPLKLLNPVRMANVTIGLPVVRTSPCHGTAYDIAGKYIASESSFLYAIETAINIVRNRNKNSF